MRSTILSGQSWPKDALESCYPVRSPSYCTCTYSTLSRSTSGHLFLVGQKQVCGDHLPFPVAACDKKIHFSEVLHHIYHFVSHLSLLHNHRYVYSCRKVSGCVVSLYQHQDFTSSPHRNMYPFHFFSSFYLLYFRVVIV